MGGLEQGHQMMQNLFGDQSEDEVESENNDDALLRPSHYQSVRRSKFFFFFFNFFFFSISNIVVMYAVWGCIWCVDEM